MSSRSNRAVVAAGLLILATGTAAQPGSGTRWEMQMQIPGMAEAMKGVEIPPGMEGMAMPGMSPGGMTQKMCLPKDPKEPPPPQEHCKVLEQHSRGNRHFMKAQCPDGLIEIDQTRSATSLAMHMKHTDKGGAVNEMDMNGRVVGDCDYTAEHAAQEQQMAGMKKQTEDARHKGEAQIAATCEQGLQEMQGVMFGKDGPCPTRRPEFCKRLQTQDGYVKFRDATADTGQLPGYAAADQLKMCGLSEAAVLAKLCPKAASAVDFRFVHDSCPSQRPALCDDAMERKELWYIAEHCAAERTQLVAENCVGRKYSAQIAPEYRDFCTGALAANLGGSTPAGAGEVQEPQKPEDKVEQGVKKGLEGLKKIFGN